MDELEGEPEDDDGKAQLRIYVDRVIEMFEALIARLPPNAAVLAVDWEATLSAGAFFVEIEVRPRKTNAAFISGGISTTAEFNFTFGNVWIEYWNEFASEDVALNDLAELVDAAFAGRFFSYGGRDGYGGYLDLDGRKHFFGNLLVMPLRFLKKPHFYHRYK